jgi:hypothetical protein
MTNRTERPEQIMAPALRSIIKRIDLAIENGSLDPKDRDEVIKMFISGPTTVVDNKAGGGMMNMNEMIRPLGYEKGTRDGTLVGDREKMYAAPPPDPRDPDDLDMIINNMTFRVLHDKDRPMKENITRENYFDILPEEQQQIAEQLRMQLGISSDSSQYEYIRNKIIEEADKINKIRQEESQPTSTKIFRGIGKLFGMEGNN